MKPFRLQVSNDRSRLTLSIPDTQRPIVELTATELDTFVHQLAECRATMTPIHPAEPPKDSNCVYRNDNLLIKISPCQSIPAIEIAVQQPGLGWTVTTLARDQAEDMQRLIDMALQGIPTRAMAT